MFPFFRAAHRMSPADLTDWVVLFNELTKYAWVWLAGEWLPVTPDTREFRPERRSVAAALPGMLAHRDLVAPQIWSFSDSRQPAFYKARNKPVPYFKRKWYDLLWIADTGLTARLFRPPRFDRAGKTHFESERSGCALGPL